MPEQDEGAGQAGMGEEEYEAAAAQTAELAAQLPKIGVVGRRPPQGPSMPQRLINHFRSPEAVLGRHMTTHRHLQQISSHDGNASLPDHAIVLSLHACLKFSLATLYCEAFWQIGMH